MEGRNLIISLEGIDGSGKGTQLTNLFSAIKDHSNGFLGNKYSNIFATREPTKDTAPGKTTIEGMAKGTLTPEEAKIGFIQDRLEHTQNYILPEFAKGSFVLTDRYDLSTFAYQHTQGVSFDELYDLHKYTHPFGTIIPHLTVVFDLPYKVAVERVNARDEKKEQFEKEEFQKQLVSSQTQAINYLQKRQPGREFVIVNANQSVANVTEEMIAKISTTYAAKTGEHATTRNFREMYADRKFKQIHF